MNPRRIHDLMREQFPVVDAAQQAWTNIADDQGLLLKEQTFAIIAQPFLSHGVQEVLVEVHRKLGGLVPATELTEYVALHVGQGKIRIADRAFSLFAIVATNGVATSWQRA